MICGGLRDEEFDRVQWILVKVSCSWVLYPLRLLVWPLKRHDLLLQTPKVFFACQHKTSVDSKLSSCVFWSSWYLPYSFGLILVQPSCIHRLDTSTKEPDLFVHTKLCTVSSGYLHESCCCTWIPLKVELHPSSQGDLRHLLSTSPQEIGWFSQTIHLSEDDKQNSASTLFLAPYASFARILM